MSSEIPSIACGEASDGGAGVAATADSVDETPVVTHHKIPVGGKTLDYTATVAQMPLKNERGETEAHIFYMAYTLDGVPDSAKRPLTFAFNGGPGSASIWLDMGALGPKRVVLNPDGFMPAAPYRMEDNPYTLLDKSDLVMIDAINTGFSRAENSETLKKFWGVKGDIEAFSEFIRLYISRNERWSSPLYLFGESYGTTRSSVVANILENGDSIDLNGVILLSQIFNFTSDIDAARGNPGIDLPFQLALPTYAASAFYHHKLPSQPASLEPFLKEVEDFVMGEYAHALAQGTDLTSTEKQTVAEKLHNYTGLPVAYLMKADLRVSGGGFSKNLQDDQDLTTGRLDTRFSGPTLNPLSEEAEYDPQSNPLNRALFSAFGDALRSRRQAR